jgi:hypothetical protein
MQKQSSLIRESFHAADSQSIIAAKHPETKSNDLFKGDENTPTLSNYEDDFDSPPRLARETSQSRKSSEISPKGVSSQSPHAHKTEQVAASQPSWLESSPMKDVGQTAPAALISKDFRPTTTDCEEPTFLSPTPGRVDAPQLQVAPAADETKKSHTEDPAWLFDD